MQPGRAENGYRDYGENEVHKLHFVARARSLGFSLEDCRQLLSLYEDQHRASSSVKRIAESKISDIDTKLEELNAMRNTLSKLVRSCHGDERPECPILEELGKQHL